MKELLINVLEFISRIKISLDYPYIDFGVVKATPALVLCILYFVILVVVSLFGVVRNKIKLEFLFKESISCGTRIKIMRSICAYGLICAVFWSTIPFLKEITLLSNVINAYLQFEPIVVLGILMFFCSAFFSKYNWDKHIIVANRFLQYTIPLIVAAGFFDERIVLSYWPNRIAFGFLSAFYFLLLVVEGEKSINSDVENNHREDISYNPVDDLDQLFPQHRAQAERLAKIILDSSSEPFSVCLSGKWGTGKTSVVNGVVKLLEKKDKDNYVFIHINAIELDSKETLLNYFMTEIKHCLEERGVYVGVASEYKDFLLSVVGTVTMDSIATLIQKKFLGNEKDYRKEKHNLEKLLNDSFGNGKIVLIVDDIERCQPDVAKDYLFLIKEVATMKNCVSIFITDYDVLLNLFEKDTMEKSRDLYGIDSEFLDKFFNHRINLYDETPEDILMFFDESFKEEDTVFKSIYEMIAMSPGTWYKHALEELDLRIIAQEETNERYHLSNEEDRKTKENKLIQMKQNREKFVKYMKNPRYVVKFYNSFNRNMQYGYKQLLENKQDEQEKKVILKYIRERNVGQIIAFLSFAEVYLPEQLQEIIETKAYYIEPVFYPKNISISEGQQFLLELASATIYKENSEESKLTNYIKEEIRRFINMFLEPNGQLSQLVKPFTTQEEEWISAINNDEVNLIELYWNEMVNMVLSKYSSENKTITIQWKIDMFKTLLEYAVKKIGWGGWKADKVFTVFENDNRGRTFADGIGMMQVYLECIQNSIVTSEITEETINNTIDFARYYSYHRVDSMYKLFQYITPYEDGNKINNFREILLDSTQNLETNIQKFVNKIIMFLPITCSEDCGWLEKFQEIARYIKNYLEEQDHLKYDDIKKEVEHMMDSVNELSCMCKILELIQKDTAIMNEREITTKDYLNIDKTINDFEEVINHIEQYNNRDVEKEFGSFLVYLKNSTEVKLNNYQKEKLHDLITVLAEETGCYSFYYRKMLLHI